MTQRVFLLSPASCTGKRAQQLLRADAAFELALRLRDGGVPLGEVFSFLSALYFRGKLTYATRFAAPPAACPGVFVITPNRGLVVPETSVGLDDLRGFARGSIDLDDRRYTAPLARATAALRETLSRDVEVVLLGSIATPKYVDLLLRAFAGALRFPSEFVGRGDMSRGGILLRAARAGVELDYRPLDGAVRHGPRPAKLPREART
ncbi:MAG TPA: hypothetical protein VMR50_06580 [Myxococcota bacterium]|nr:hypothetical protein [Myxococcota bacterium]